MQRVHPVLQARYGSHVTMQAQQTWANKLGMMIMGVLWCAVRNQLNIVQNAMLSPR